jgi:hypothetical protein
MALLMTTQTQEEMVCMWPDEYKDLNSALRAARSDYAALVEAVKWESECRYVRNVMRLWHRWPAQDEAQTSYLAARAAVDALVGEG